MKTCTILFPHQLFWPNPALIKGQEVVLIEESLFFSLYPFHQQKIVLHRASMRAYAELLRQHGYTVFYIEATSKEHDLSVYLKNQIKKGLGTLHYIDPIDDWLHKKILQAKNLKLVRYDSPGFLNTLNEINTYFDQKKTYFQTDFYCWQRKQRKILVDEKRQPIGGKWTFDDENRKRYPSGLTPPSLPTIKSCNYTTEAIQYVKKNFASNPGSTESFIYPVTRQAAKDWLKDFIKNRFQEFGPYEDAMSMQHPWLHHSLLSPLLNIGLLQPNEITTAALDAAKKKEIPLNSLEGFIRQVTGWREFIRAVYEREGGQQRTRNYWGFKRKIPASFWNGTTGIIPIDHLIHQLQKHAYTHHIERLMVLGNFMLLCEFDPDEVYQWFMEWYIDSYDWVMVPNVYGMTQFADGGIMTTKPYISGSNYLLKMGNWEKGEPLSIGNDMQANWSEIWDGLFWRFMDKQRKFFSSNPRLGMLLKTLDKMNAAKKERLFAIANGYLDKLDQTKH